MGPLGAGRPFRAILARERTWLAQSAAHLSNSECQIRRRLEAQGLALALVSPSAFIELLAYAGAGQVDWVIGLPLALGGMAAISAGVAFASRLPERRMRLAFCALLLLTAVLLALRG